uniref:Transmembrane protein n=1 Tax=Gossypium raimondii TaxID=29730 RepID=A0A0D2M3L5_GOSRA|nr:hypothetical protein B456_001G266200 [Gossypium raimondii]
MLINCLKVWEMIRGFPKMKRKKTDGTWICLVYSLYIACVAVELDGVVFVHSVSIDVFWISMLLGLGYDLRV